MVMRLWQFTVFTGIGVSVGVCVFCDQNTFDEPHGSGTSKRLHGRRRRSDAVIFVQHCGFARRRPSRVVRVADTVVHRTWRGVTLFPASVLAY